MALRKDGQLPPPFEQHNLASTRSGCSSPAARSAHLAFSLHFQPSVLVSGAGVRISLRFRWRRSRRARAICLGSRQGSRSSRFPTPQDDHSAEEATAGSLLRHSTVSITAPEKRHGRLRWCPPAVAYSLFFPAASAPPITTMHAQKLDADQLEELKEAFNLFDTDGNGARQQRSPYSLSLSDSGVFATVARVLIACTRTHSARHTLVQAPSMPRS